MAENDSDKAPTQDFNSERFRSAEAKTENHMDNDEAAGQIRELPMRFYA